MIDGCSRGGGRRLCKEDVGWIVDLKNFLASWSLRSDMVGRSARKISVSAISLRLVQTKRVDARQLICINQMSDASLSYTYMAIGH